MDEDDSQDELINCSTSQNKGKRAALWAISDDSDDAEEESVEGESDSGEDEEEGHLDGEEDEEDDEEGNEEDDDEEEEEEDGKAEGGAIGGTSADLADLSSDEEAEKCPICLNSFNSQPVATPENCVHYFCLDCILEWAKNANLCPIDRINFNNIHLRKCYGGKVQKVITVQKPVKQEQQEVVNLDLEQTSCEVCGGSDREDRLLLCDGCDAGYHMECLTPPLDAVPVEEWFCPECEANNRQPRGSAEELSETESLPSTARPTSSRSQSRFAGPTRAIARTQHSERVRANVNRNRITQARTSQLAPTYLIQSTWLDETINAVVAGLNTAVYVRDFAPRVPTRRRRQTRRRRRVKSKKTSSAKGKGKAATTGVKRRKRKVRRLRSKKKLMAQKTVTPRGRIANNLGIVKDKKSSSLPTVYRPSEHTLSSMRADIGAASLSIYGDPFDLDPFVDREEEEQQTNVSSLLQAKRRGISHSAFRSHQPVARPVTASLSRRGVDVPQSGVVEAAPVPDLLGSILSGQSMLLMDSSDVVINRDGSLKATKPMSLSSSVKPSCSGSSGDISTCVNPVMSPNHVDISPSLQCNRNLPGTSESSAERHFSHSSSLFPPFTSSTASHREPGPHSNLPPRGHPSLQAPQPRGPTLATGHQGINRARDRRETISSSSHLTSDSSSKSGGPAPSQSQPKKAPTKPMWVDVSVLPRIPKIKRESSVSADDATSQVGSSGNDRRSSRASSSSSTTSTNSSGMRETGINSLAGDKGRQHSVDQQQQGRTDGQAQRHRADGAGSSSSFSNSFSSSSSSTGSHSSQPCCSSLSSSSSSVSFRISSSGNSWHSRRLSITSSTTSGGNMQERRKQKEDEAKKRQLHRDKQMLLASHTVSKEEDSNTIYDPFNPTVSESSTSDDEGESTSWEGKSRLNPLEGKSPSLRSNEYLVQSNKGSVQVKTEKQESPVSQGELRTAAAQETVSWELGFPKEDIKIEQETGAGDTNIGTQSALLKNTVKKEPDDADKGEGCDHNLKRYLDSNTEETTPLDHHHNAFFNLLKTEKDIKKEESGHNTGTPNTVSSNSWKTPPGSSSASTEKKQKTDTKPESSSKSPSRDSGNIKKTSKKHVSSKDQRTRSSSSETDRCRRGDRTASTQGGSQKGKDKDRVKTSRRSRSKERRRAHTDSESSRSNSPDRSSRKRRRSRSRSKNRRRSRSESSSSSREHSRGRKHKRRSKERYDGRERDHERRRVTKDKRRDRSRSRSRSRDNRRRSRSKSRSRSRTRSRSRERRKDHTTQPSSTQSSRHRVESRSREQRRGRSRSRSREKKKEDGSSKSSQKTPGSGVSSSKDTKLSKDKKKDKDCPVKEEKVAKTSKREVPSSIPVSKVKKEAPDFKEDGQDTNTEIIKKEKDVKEIKKEKTPLFDMFEDSPINTPVKTEEVDTPISSVPECIKEEGTQKDPIKAEACEMKTVKLETSSPDPHQINPVLSLSVVTASSTPSVCEPLTASPLLTDTTEQPSTDVSTVPIKQEAQQPSDSDEDFNVDVMLDNLDFVKSESAEGKGASVKQEKEVEEVKHEGGQVLSAVGAKSKTQVKRVTWNIQEPEGPQPEKSASKVALYKLKLKQEGVRRPSSAVPTSTQDISGAVSVSDSSKKAGAGPQIFSSRFDSSHPEELLTTGQGVAEEGDVSRKDQQYLKKLHMQERAIEEVKLAIKPFYQKRDINKDEYKEILRKAVQKVCHSKSGEINPVKVGNLVKAYVDKYKHARKHKKGEDSGRSEGPQSEAMKTSDSP